MLERREVTRMPKRKRRKHKARAPSEYSRDMALHALATMRTEGASLSKAAKEFSVSPRTVLKVARTAMIKQPNGRYRPKGFDRLRRRMWFIVENGQVPIDTHSSKAATLIARHADAVQKFLQHRAGAEILDEFRGKSIKVRKERYEFICDPYVLKRWGNAGPGYENIYASNY